MRFTLWAVGVPFTLFALTFLFRSNSNPLPFGYGIPVMLAAWFWVGLPCTALYWIVRLVRHAWRDGSARSSARPAGWIYPDQR